MTSERMEELHALLLAMSRQVDNWCIHHGESRSKKGMETLQTMLQARQVAKDLMKALMQESIEGQMLRNAWLDLAGDSQPTVH